MTNTSDLTPQTSGSASIGVNQVDGIGGFAPNSIKPYSHMHVNSGVFHDITGASGLIRFTNGPGNILAGTHFGGQVPALEISSDGGISYPLRLGTIKDGGLGLGPHGVIQGGPNIENFLFVLNSGTIYIDSQTSKLYLRSHEETNIESIDDIILAAGQGVSIIGGNGSVSLSAAVDQDIFAVRNIELSTNNGDITLDSGDNAGDGLGGQISLNAFASSGRLQYRFGPHQGWASKLTHSSTGGPANDGFWPLPHSGQIAQMIAQSTPGGVVALQDAYDDGNEILVRRNANDRNVGVIIKEQNGTAVANLAESASLVHLNYMLAASGGTGANGFAFTKIVPNGISIKSSGTAAQAESTFTFGYINNLPQSPLIASQHNLAFFANQNINFDAGTANQPGGQINLSAFVGSGQIEYRHGPFASWAMKVRNSSVGGPAGDGFHPIPHSGQINMMALRVPKTKGLTIERPALNNDLTVWYTNEPITITEVESVCRGSFDASGQFAIRYSSDRSAFGTELTTNAITCTNRTTGQITTSFAAPNIPADNWIWVGVSGVSGVATSQLHLTIQYI